jgi:hypothetical protein
LNKFLIAKECCVHSLSEQLLIAFASVNKVLMSELWYPDLYIKFSSKFSANAGFIQKIRLTAIIYLTSSFVEISHLQGFMDSIDILPRPDRWNFKESLVQNLELQHLLLGAQILNLI